MQLDFLLHFNTMGTACLLTLSDDVQRGSRKPLVHGNHRTLRSLGEDFILPLLAHLHRFLINGLHEDNDAITLAAPLRNRGRKERSWGAVNAGFITFRCLECASPAACTL